MRYAQLAISSMKDRLDAAYAASLRTIETADSLPVNSLTDPVAILDYRAPADNRSPLVKTYDTGFVPDGPEGFRLDNHIASVTVEVSHTGSVDKQSTEATNRRYAEAVIRAIDGDPTLGHASDGVVDAVFVGALVEAIGDESEIRINYKLEFEVKVTTPTT